MGHMSPGVCAAAARALNSRRTSASSPCRATSNARRDSFFSASVYFISRIGHCSVAARAAIPNASSSPGPATHSLRKASTFWDCAFGVFGLTVVATRFSKAGDTFQRCPSSVTRLTVFLL
jgi:hypothetical protein